MCSMSMASPCMIDDGASCGTVPRPVTTPMIGLQLSWILLVFVLAVRYTETSSLVVATCLIVPGVQTRGIANVASPSRFLVVFCGEDQHVSALWHGGREVHSNLRC